MKSLKTMLLSSLLLSAGLSSTTGVFAAGADQGSLIHPITKNMAA